MYRDFYSPVFQIEFEAPIHPPSGRLSGPSEVNGSLSVRALPMQTLS